MKWRIAEKKMQFVRKTIWTKPVTNIARKALVQEVLCKVKALFLERDILNHWIAILINKNTLKQDLSA